MSDHQTLRLIEQVRRAYERGNGLEAIRHVRGLLRRLPHLPDLWGFLGDLQLQEELFAPAITSYRRALHLMRRGARRVAPVMPSGRIIDEAALSCALGSALARGGAPADAEQAFRRAVELRPIPDHRVALASFLELTGSTAEALAVLRAAVEDAPDHVEARYGLACAHMWTEPAEAERHLRRVLKLDDRHALAMCALGHLLFERDALRAGRRMLRRAIRLDPTVALPHVYLGHQAWRERGVDEAEKAYRAGMAADPEDPHPWFALGDLYAEENRPDEARQAYEEAIRLDPRCGDAVLRLGNLHLDAGRSQEALECFRRGLRLTPHHPWREHVRKRVRELETGSAG